MKFTTTNQLKQFLNDSYSAVYRAALHDFVNEINSVDKRFQILGMDAWTNNPRHHEHSLTNQYTFEFRANNTTGKIRFGYRGDLHIAWFESLRIADGRHSYSGATWYRYKVQFDSYGNYTSKQIVDMILAEEAKRSKKLAAAKAKNQTATES